MKATLRNFLQMESAGGLVLMAAAALALVAANSPLADYYDLFIETPVEVRVGGFEIAKPLLLWVNDGLMAVFFFLVGLEVKREILEGELSRPSNVLLPALGAVGGIVAPVGLYVLFNYGDSVGMNGWAIPAATDIAFALGILMILGKRVPVSLKVFLVSLAIFDDLGAIVIIAIFYSSKLSINALVVASLCLVILGYLNWRRVSAVPAYVLVGVVMWVAVLKSGVHATLAGVVLAMFIPMHSKDEPERSPLRELEHDLHTVIAFGVLPLFAFVNAGISFAGMSFADLLHPVSLGVASGLFVGKQLGVFLLCLLAIRLGIAKLPEGASWGSLYGVAVLSGVGFTMSLFIDTLAFQNLPADTVFDFDARLGILLGSIASGVLGYVVLHRTLPRAGH
ncbi:MAG TPA: Na+/H+ antiporter NhaA [Woeseiaceae bacterium]|nr:Na+/H+ antiporter NhaA [Woeseiaceae bacterium]